MALILSWRRPLRHMEPCELSGVGEQETERQTPHLHNRAPGQQKLASGPSASGARGFVARSRSPPGLARDVHAAPQQARELPPFASVQPDRDIAVGKMRRDWKDGFVICVFGRPDILLKPEDLDFEYSWIHLLAEREAIPVCLRISAAGRVTDIRLVGSVVRVNRNRNGNLYGFIFSPLHRKNLYFRFCDVDPVRKTNMCKGLTVGFRVHEFREQGRDAAARVYVLSPGEAKAVCALGM